ncbi:MAG TPA: putative lipid II flippase FtsW [bacterium]|nr:putative lipid II flippase FtsW [bacterium]HEX68340.1 putative lipid II flippase FtsW [bacterium]
MAHRIILIVTILLLSLGALMVYSSSSGLARERYHNPYRFLIRQIMWISLGAVFFFLTYKIEPENWRRWAKLFLSLSFLLLFLTLTPLGVRIGGANRWLKFGPLTFQPVELVKFSLLLWMADLLERRRKEIKDFSTGLVPPLLVIGIFVVILLKQPDLGSALLILMVCFSLFFIGGASVKHLTSLFLLSLPVLYTLIMMKGYRKRRLIAFLNPWANAKDAGYQLVQSLIALGSGGVWGKGLGKSTQKLFYLPSAYNDFIFSIIGEELGLVGASTVVLLFLIFLLAGLRIALNARSEFSSYLALGITLLISLQGFINLGVSVGLLPTKGIPLPLVSAGGSSLVITLGMIGILARIGKES